MSEKPLIDNGANIELNSTGEETDLQLAEHGTTFFSPVGTFILSDSAHNLVTGMSGDFTSTADTIFGSGQLQQMQTTPVNEVPIVTPSLGTITIGAVTPSNSGTFDVSSNGELGSVEARTTVDTVTASNSGTSDVTSNGDLGSSGATTTADSVIASHCGSLDASSGLEVLANVLGKLLDSAQFSSPTTPNIAGLVIEHALFTELATGTLNLQKLGILGERVSDVVGGNQSNLADNATLTNTWLGDAHNLGTQIVADGDHTANITLLGQNIADQSQATDDQTVGTLIHPHIG